MKTKKNSGKFDQSRTGMNEPALSKTQALKILTKIARTDATPVAERIAALGLLAELQGWAVKRVHVELSDAAREAFGSESSELIRGIVGATE